MVLRIVSDVLSAVRTGTHEMHVPVKTLMKSGNSSRLVLLSHFPKRVILGPSIEALSLAGIQRTSEERAFSRRET